MRLHASTQASGHEANAAKMLAECGFERMVAARELSCEDLTKLCQTSPIEIETFIHGALCVCHSGQCLMSSMIGGRSGNRGNCLIPVFHSGELIADSNNGTFPLFQRESLNRTLADAAVEIVVHIVQLSCFVFRHDPVPT